MKILHCCLSCFYIEGYNYQENALPRQNKKDGHEVLILASTETFSDGVLSYLPPQTYVNDDGIKVIRVPYKKSMPHTVMKKLRFYKGVYKIVEEFKPDVILFHGTGAGELLTIRKYVKKNSEVKLFVDAHEDFNNSATGFISKQFLHKGFYKPILKKTIRYIEKVLYITDETGLFLEELYKIKKENLELFPLGGEIFSDEDYSGYRNEIRNQLGLDEDDILYVHSGKMDSTKKTCELMKAYSETKNSKSKLVIIGYILDDIKKEFDYLINKDENIIYLGWKSGGELLKYLCAADLYLQPGTGSATMQNAVCCRCPVMVYPYKSYKTILKDNVFWVEDLNDAKDVFEKIEQNSEILINMKKESYKIALELFDYKKLANRILE